MSQTLLLETKPDVLVVGGGQAALMAALAVRENGRSAAIVSLGRVGGSGNTVVAGAVMSTASPDPGNTAELFLRDLTASGQGIADPALVSRLANESESMLARLESLGILFRRKGDGFERRHPPGHSIPRTLATDWSNVAFAARGMTFLEPLEKRVNEAGIPLVSGFRVTELLKDGDRVVGVAGYNRKTGIPGRICAGSVILATGGFGSLFRRNNNVSDMYGDGIAMALEAGCTLRDMEFIQFYPFMVTTPVKATMSEPTIRMGGVLRNKDRESFMERYYPTGGVVTRDAAARAIWLEVRAGRGVDGSVWADCTKVDEASIPLYFQEFYDLFAKRGVDLRKDWIKVSPTVHYTLGGVRIDRDGRTDVKGLYAAGEITGGVHGVNRLTGCALMEASIFGRAAGIAAARDALPAPAACPAPAENGGDSAASRDAVARDLNELKDILWDYASLVRNAEGLQTGLKGILQLRDKWAGEASLPGKAFARNLLVAEAVVRSALARTESRGAHYRTDYLETDPAWVKAVTCSLKDGDLAIGEQPVGG